MTYNLSPPLKDIYPTTPIFRDMYSLEIEMKNTTCYRLGTMLYLEIQKGEKAMKTPYFQKYIRGYVAIIKRLMMATKGCSQLTSNESYFAYRWLSGVKNNDEAVYQGVDYCGPVKMIHKGFCLATLE